MTTQQLPLIDTNVGWKLDPETIRIGRAGLAAARAQLAQHAENSAPNALAEDGPFEGIKAKPKKARRRRRSLPASYTRPTFPAEPEPAPRQARRMVAVPSSQDSAPVQRTLPGLDGTPPPHRRRRTATGSDSSIAA